MGVIEFPRACKNPEPETVPIENVERAHAMFLVDQLLEAQYMLDCSDAGGKEYWTGARDWMKSLVTKEMLNKRRM
jgi:hypothetical protein